MNKATIGITGKAINISYTKCGGTVVRKFFGQPESTPYVCSICWGEECAKQYFEDRKHDKSLVQWNISDK